MESYLTNYINKVVLFRVSPSFIKDCQSLLQTNNEASLLYGILVAVDGLGCWVANRTWQTIDVKTKKKSRHNTHFLIPWNYLTSVAVFPDRTFDDAPEEEDARGIGFL